MLTKARATQLCTCGCLKEGICEENMKVERRGFYGRSASKHQSLFTFWPTAYFLCFFLKKKPSELEAEIWICLSQRTPSRTYELGIFLLHVCLLLENVHMWEPTAQLLWPLLRHFLQANMLKFKYVHFNKSTFHQLQGRNSVHTGSISWLTYFLLP